MSSSPLPAASPLLKEPSDSFTEDEAPPSLSSQLAALSHTVAALTEATHRLEARLERISYTGHANPRFSSSRTSTREQENAAQVERFLKRHASDTILGTSGGDERQEGGGGGERLLLYPGQGFRLWWDVVSVLLVLFTLISLPYRIAFILDWSLFLTVIDLLIDIFFIVDLPLNFITAHRVKDELVTSYREIAKLYLRSWFAVDLIASIPIDWFLPDGLPVFADPFPNATYTTDDVVGGLSRFIRIAKVLKLLRLLRLLRLVRLLGEFAESSVPLSGGSRRVLKLACFMALFSHWNGCIQFLIAQLEGFPADSWVVRAGIHTKTPFVQWSWSFFHSNCQMLSIAVGVLNPERTIEVWSYLVSMVLGAILYAIFVASLTTVIHDANASGRAYQTKVDMVNNYIRHTKLPAVTKHKLRTYFKLCFPAKKAFDEKAILSEITRPLREEVCMHKCRDVLGHLHALENSEAGLKGSLSQALQPVVFVEGDYIIRSGWKAEAMYFITSGKVHVMSSKGSSASAPTHVATLGEGSFFGEVAMLSSSQRAISDVLVKEHVKGFTLNYSDFRWLSEIYPSFKVWLEAVVRLRLVNTEAGAELVSSTATASTNGRVLKRCSTSEHIDLQDLIDANDRRRQQSANRERSRPTKMHSNIRSHFPSHFPSTPLGRSLSRRSRKSSTVPGSFAAHASVTHEASSPASIRGSSRV
ncbi:hypothetical protein AB1Y20_012316 [Prymnesium parvum]|uniref:Cyclic nucleotide-binding domain-containing protein n=1 Tax=Prymnesium parvum TaxID=97485 RepID=A0AB34IR05_PRYPA